MNKAPSVLFVLMVHNGLSYIELPKTVDVDKYHIDVEVQSDKNVYRLRRNGCPICEYPDTVYIPHSQEICVCCGNQFGYTDCNTKHTELRERWIQEGMKWWSEHTPAPDNWNPIDQLAENT